jgi:hypothetical protein
MAVTILLADSTVKGKNREQIVKVTADAAYPEGGYPVTADQFGLVQVLAVVACNPVMAAQVMQFNPDTMKIQIFTEAYVEVAADSDQSAMADIRMIVTGIGV